MARYYLSNSTLELNEAASLRGFEDLNSFRRAFRGWEGIPPTNWREIHRTFTAIQISYESGFPAISRSPTDSAFRFIPRRQSTQQGWKPSGLGE
jgi:AraC-like DNA-binding protein